MSTPNLNVDKTTYSVVDFLEWHRQGSLDLQPYYQRRAVWNPRIKSLLIDSLLRGYPLPLIFLHSRLDTKTSRSIRQVVDGQQRLRTILSYIDIDSLKDADDWDRFTVLPSHNPEYGGLSFNQLSEAHQTLILQTRLSVNILPMDISDATVLTIFQRMNSTGLKLNNQEIRNSKFFGEFKDLSYALAYEQNQRWTSWQIFSRQKLAQMEEVELTSDLLGYLIRGVSASSKASVDKLYRDYDTSIPEREALADKFRRVFNYLSGVYAESASKSGVNRFRSTAWFYAVFAVATSAMENEVSPKLLVSALEAGEIDIREKAIDLDEHKYLRGATGDKSSRTGRINFIEERLEKLK